MRRTPVYKIVVAVRPDGSLPASNQHTCPITSITLIQLRLWAPGAARRLDDGIDKISRTLVYSRFHRLIQVSKSRPASRRRFSCTYTSLYVSSCTPVGSSDAIAYTVWPRMSRCHTTFAHCRLSSASPEPPAIRVKNGACTPEQYSTGIRAFRAHSPAKLI